MNSRDNTWIFVVIFFLILTCVPLGDSQGDNGNDAETLKERSDLIQLRDSLSSAMNLHSNWTGPPCFNDRSLWFGITCSNSNVVGIDLKGIHLTGSLPATVLQNITYLTNLSLSDNALHGNLPSLRGLVNLRSVSLRNNRFSGSIPTEYVGLRALSRLELQDNALSGEIPPFHQQSLTLLNVSNNFLLGQIPNTSVLQSFPKSIFAHNSGLCGKPLGKACSSSPVPSIPTSTMPNSPSTQTSGKSSSTKRLKPWMLALISISAILFAFMFVSCLLYYYSRSLKKGEKEQSSGKSVNFMEKGVKSSGSVPESRKILDLEFFDKGKANFNLDDLLKSSAEMIGKGNLGNSYRVKLQSGSKVVVKRLKYMGVLSEKEFVQHMNLLGGIRHPNLVEIVSFYSNKEERLVVYDYLQCGSLYNLLHDKRGEGRVALKWASRLQIVKGIAKGLAHLHYCLPTQKAPHGNLKSSNVLAHCSNGCTQSKLADFGFQPLLTSTKHMYKLAISKVPEVSQGSEMSHSADVYCFGLILLEIITGHITTDREKDLPGWVRLVINNNWSTDVLDSEIVAEKDSHADMFRLTEIALQCTASEPDIRPKMTEVVKWIEEINESKK